MRAAGLFLSLSMITACQMQTPDTGGVDTRAQPASGRFTAEIWRCYLAPDLVAYANDISQAPDLSQLSPFLLMRWLQPDEHTMFGVYTVDDRATAGIGQRQPDGRWLVRNWSPETDQGPFVTFMTVFPDDRALVSYYSGPRGHVTYAARCTPAPLPDKDA